MVRGRVSESCTENVILAAKNWQTTDFVGFATTHRSRTRPKTLPIPITEGRSATIFVNSLLGRKRFRTCNPSVNGRSPCCFADFNTDAIAPSEISSTSSRRTSPVAHDAA